jgi:hypothetical protein
MPRSNRPRRPTGRPGGNGPADDEGDLSRLRAGWRRTESRQGREWNVQPVSPAKAVKAYTCPGCSVPIETGTAHLVVWRADGVLGDTSDLASRRHWHSHCWKIGA